MDRPRIVTLTLNPALDLSGEVDRLVPRHKLRCRDTRRDPGGGGINVARVLSRLDAKPVAVFAAGGCAGTALEGLVSQEGVAHVAVRVVGETRENFAIRDRSSGEQYRFVLPGPTLSDREIEACSEAALRRLQPSSWLIASGSLPADAPADTYARLARGATAIGAKFVLDASGEALQKAIRERPYLVKVSQRELGEATGLSVTNRLHCIRAAHALVAAGATHVAVTSGEGGALLVGPCGEFRARGPKLAMVSQVGAGDAFLAALVWDLARGLAPAPALQSAVAAGSAAVLEPGTQLCGMAEIEALRAKVRVDRLETMAKKPARAVAVGE